MPADHAASLRAMAQGGLQALCLIARLHHVAADAAQVARQLGWSPHHAAGIDELLLAAKHLGLKAKLTRSSGDRLALVPLPALAVMADGNGATRAVVLAQCDGQRVLIQDPSGAVQGGRPVIEPLAVFEAQWTGQLILITSRAALAGALAKFDFSWFIPSLVKYRRLLGEVIVISLFLQLFALVSPLFFQVVMDKVLVHRGVSTLDVLVIGLTVVVLFESLLTTLRTYVFSHTTSRIDVELGARLFRHLLQLPLAYFQARRVGDSVARVRELENIRSFLTGNSLTLVLDVVFSVLFIAVMVLYSAPLTLIVLVSLPLYVALSLTRVPILRARLNEKFARGAENQALLVEAVTGIQTVKASALEPAMAKRWDDQLAGYAAASFKTQTLASWGHEGINLIGKLINAATLWYGAHLVMDQQLTVGQFVAFNMFAQRVAQPIMRTAQMWTDFQQTGISMARLGDILDTRTEVPPMAAAQLPPLKGRIQFDQVTFRYRSEAPPVLHGLSLEVRAGEVIGIVGRSGSGKSTLTKLVQRPVQPGAGAGDGRRHRHQPDRRRATAPPDRRGAAREPAVQPQRAREDRDHRPGRTDRGRDAGRTDGRRARVHQRAARGLRHGGGRTGQQLVGRPAPAHRDCPCALHEPARADLRRGDERARLRKRGKGSTQHGRDLPGPHGDRDRAPAELGAACTSHHRDGQGPHRRRGQPRRAAEAAGRVVCALVVDAVGGVGMNVKPAAQRHPITELLARYGAILKAAWAARHELAGPKRLADEAAFLPAALSLQETPAHPAPRRAAWAICALFVVALAWSILGQVDIVAVAPGRIVVSERTKTLQPLEAGVVKRACSSKTATWCRRARCWLNSMRRMQALTVPAFWSN
jgi:subfamily B ATP-binding cassette protein HlyB/CyaB